MFTIYEITAQKLRPKNLLLPLIKNDQYNFSMKRILFTLAVLLCFTATKAQTFNFGGKLEGGALTQAEVTKITSTYDNIYVIGTYTDSVQLDIMGTAAPGTYVLHAPTAGQPTAFIAVYNGYGDVSWAISLGNGGANLVELKDIVVDYYEGRLIVGGNFEGSNNFNPLGAGYYASATTGKDAFFAVYSLWDGYMQGHYVLENTGSNASINGIAIDYYGNLCVTGHYDNQIDFSPDGSVNTQSSDAGSIDAFVAKYDQSDFNTLIYAYTLGGTTGGNEYGLYITADYDDGLIATGTFDSNIYLDATGPGALKTSLGARDIFQVRYDYYGYYLSGMSLGGTNDDLPKGICSTDGFYDDMVLLSEFSNTINLNPAGSAPVTSAGGTDVAVSRYSLSGAYKHGKRLGNSAPNAAQFIVKASSGGGGKLLRSIEGSIYLGMSFQGTLDVNPDPAIDNNVNANNTPINTAIIELDTTLSLISYTTIEAQNTTSMAFSDYYGNDIALAGSFSGSGVDILPYEAVQGYTHTSGNAGFISYFNECHFTANVIIPNPYECGTCTATLGIQSEGAIGGLDYAEWWGPSYGYELTLSNACPGFYYLDVYDSHGCYASDEYEIMAHDTVPTLTVTTNHSSCNTNGGSASVTVSYNDGPYTIVWSSGDTTATTDSLAAGVYTVTVQDTLSCYVQETFIINDSDGPSITVNTTSNPTCSGGTGSIDVTVTGGVAPLTYQWSNGATTEDLINVAEGTYALIVTDANGCRSQVCVTLSSPTPVEITNFDIVTPSTCGSNDGTIAIDVMGGTAPYTYLWNDPLAQTTDSAVSLAAGVYTVIITDAAGCTYTKKVPLSDYTGPYIAWYYDYSPSCEDPNGYIETTIWGWDPITFLWEDGSTNEDLYGITDGGTFYQEATDVYGCKSVFYYELQQILPNTPNVCMVTVDETGTQNVVIWDKTTTPEAVSYNIYREGFCSSSDFLPIGNVISDSLSVFYDTVVNTETKSWQYYVTAIDACGYESLPSEINKTIHLTSHFTSTMEVELNWEAYIGRVIDQYDIFRSTAADSTIFVQIDSVPGNVLTYTDDDDLSAYAGHTIEYYIEAIPEDPCYASRAFNQNASRSNHTRLGMTGEIIIDTTSINNVPGIDEFIRIFPNPANDQLQINVSGSKTNYTATITNSLGQHMHSYSFNRSVIVSTSALPNGVYYICMTSSEQKTKVYKLVISH